MFAEQDLSLQKIVDFIKNSFVTCEYWFVVSLLTFVLSSKLNRIFLKKLLENFGIVPFVTTGKAINPTRTRNRRKSTVKIR